MKKAVQLLLVIFISFMIFSCSEDEGGDSLSGDLIGRWVPDYLLITIDGVAYTVDASEFHTCDIFLEFKADNTATIEDYYGESCELVEISNAVWSQDGNSIIFTGFNKDDPQLENIWEILELSTTVLKVRDLNEIASLDDEDDFDDVIRAYRRL